MQTETATLEPQEGFQGLWLPGGSDGEAAACSVTDPGFHPWAGKIRWRRGWYLLQYSCLESPTDRGVWRATVHGVAKSRTRLSDCHFSDSPVI